MTGRGPNPEVWRQCPVCGERKDLTPESGGLVCEVCGTVQPAPPMSASEAMAITRSCRGVGRLAPLTGRDPLPDDVRRKGGRRGVRADQARQGRGVGGGCGIRRIVDHENLDLDAAEARDDGSRRGAGTIQPHIGEDSVTSIIADAEADALDELGDELPLSPLRGERDDDRWRPILRGTKAEQLEAERANHDRIALERVGLRKGRRRG